MYRRFVAYAETYDEGINDNPYAFVNASCELIDGVGGWILTENRKRD